jgi:hypothetical protein
MNIEVLELSANSTLKILISAKQVTLKTRNQNIAIRFSDLLDIVARGTGSTELPFGAIVECERYAA